MSSVEHDAPPVEETTTEPDNRTNEEKILDLQINIKVLNDSVKLLLKENMEKFIQRMKPPEAGNIDKEKFRIDDNSKIMVDHATKILGRLIPNSTIIDREELLGALIILIKNECITPFKSILGR